VVIEVVSWAGSGKIHAINQEFPQRTCCGVWLPTHAVKHDDPDNERMPTCLNCMRTVMNS